MKGFKPFLILGLAVVLATFFGCGGKVPQNGPAPLNFVVVKLPDGAVPEPYKKVIVVSGGLQPYTYSITAGSLPPGITMDTSGVVSGTPTAAGAYPFTVKVVDSQTPVQAYNTEDITLTINPQLSIPPTPLANATVAVPYSAAITATGGTKPYTYSVTSDPNCVFSTSPNCSSSNEGLTFSAGGAIAGTPVGPTGTFNFTVQVADGGAAVATANVSITIIGKLQGNYAFSFTGYDNSSNPATSLYLVGSLVADGNGNITGGVLDRNGNDAVGPLTSVPITGGTYTIGSNELGIMTLITGAPLGATYQFSITVSVLSDSRFILADKNYPNLWGSGVLRPQQNLSGVTLTSSNFAFGLSGVDGAGSRYGGAGYFKTDLNGNISAGMSDINDAGTMQNKAPLTGTVSTTDPTTGRGTATFNIGSTTLHYAFYVVPPTPPRIGNEVLAVQTDPISKTEPVTLASFLQRGAAAGGSFSNLFLNTNYLSNPAPPSTNAAIFELNAISNSAPDVSLGPGQFDGAGNIKSYALDENSGGTLTSPAQYPYTSGSYNVDDPTSGRVTVNLAGAPYQPVWYLVSFNSGFVVGSDPSVTTGSFEPQNTLPPYYNTNLFGTFYGGSIAPVLSTVTNEVDSTSILPPPPPGGLTGTVTSTYDTSGGLTGLQSNQTLAGIYCMADQTNANPYLPNCQPSNTTGRTAILNSNNAPVEILYIVAAGASGATNAGTRVVSLNVGKTDGSPETNPRLNVRVR